MKIKDLVKSVEKKVERVVGGEKSKLDELYSVFKKAMEDGKEWDALFIADVMLLLRQGGERGRKEIDWVTVEHCARRFRMAISESRHF
jgi:hypothetical protein